MALLVHRATLEKWIQNDGMILFQYDTANKTTYGGNFTGNVMVGRMSTFAGLNGCWYAIKDGGTIMRDKEHKLEFDSSGTKARQGKRKQITKSSGISSLALSKLILFLQFG